MARLSGLAQGLSRINGDASAVGGILSGVVAPSGIKGSVAVETPEAPTIDPIVQDYLEIIYADTANYDVDVNGLPTKVNNNYQMAAPTNGGIVIGAAKYEFKWLHNGNDGSNSIVLYGLSDSYTGGEISVTACDYLWRGAQIWYQNTYRTAAGNYYRMGMVVDIDGTVSWTINGALYYTYPEKASVGIAYYPYCGDYYSGRSIIRSSRAILVEDNVLGYSPEVWFDGIGSTKVLSDGTHVARWNDRSGNLNHFRQTGLTKQPETNNNSLQFMGDDIMDLDNPLTLDADCEVFAVVQNTAWSTAVNMILGYPINGYDTEPKNEGRFQITSSLVGRLDKFNDGAFNYAWDTSRTLDNSYYVIAQNKTKTWVNNIEALNSMNDLAQWRVDTLGGHYSADNVPNSNRAFIGRVMEIIIINRALSDEERDDIKKYLEMKYTATKVIYQ